MRELERYGEVVVDLGTGDGKFVLREARARPEALVVGIDTVADAFAAAASRARRKPARGGAENAVFLTADATSPPRELRGRASLVTVNFPWGSLLRAVAEPEPRAMREIVALLRPGGRLVALLNLSATDDPAYADKLSLPSLDEAQIVPGWEAAGLRQVESRRLEPGEEPPHRTSWGQRLVRGSGRETLLVSGVRG